MLLADEFKLSNRRANEHYVRTMWLGWIPAGVALLMLYAQPDAISPFVLGSLGLAIAFEMILWSGRAIHRTRDPLTPFSRRLVENSDKWFPHFLMFIQGMTVCITVLLLWYSICQLGVRSVLIQNLILFLALVLHPLRRMCSYASMTEPTRRKDVLRELVHYLQIISVTLFFALTAHMAVLPPGQMLAEDVPVGAIMVWIPAVLVVISCVVLFIDHIVRKQPAVAGTADLPTTQGSKDTF